MAAHHTLGPCICLSPLTPMTGVMTASRRLMTISGDFRGIPRCLQGLCTRPPVATASGRRPAWGFTLALFRLVTKQQSPQPLEAELGLL
jgi:hypothetical protein